MISQRMVKTNQDIIGGQCRRSDGVLLEFNYEDEKIVLKNYQERLMNTEFVWGRNNLSQTDTISDTFFSRQRCDLRVNQ